jgi:hypothetical protein
VKGEAAREELTAVKPACQVMCGGAGLISAPIRFGAVRMEVGTKDDRDEYRPDNDIAKDLMSGNRMNAIQIREEGCRQKDANKSGDREADQDNLGEDQLK